VRKINPIKIVSINIETIINVAFQKHNRTVLIIENKLDNWLENLIEDDL